MAMMMPDCLFCDCKFSDGCKLEKLQAEIQKRRSEMAAAEAALSKQVRPKPPVRVPGPLRQAATDLRNARIRRGDRYYAGKELR